MCKGVILIIVSGSLENYTIVVAKDESYAKSTLISNATDKPSLSVLILSLDYLVMHYTKNILNLHSKTESVTDGYRIHVYIWIGYMLRMDIGYMFTYVITRNQPNTYCTVASALTVTVFLRRFSLFLAQHVPPAFIQGSLLRSSKTDEVPAFEIFGKTNLFVYTVIGHCVAGSKLFVLS